MAVYGSLALRFALVWCLICIVSMVRYILQGWFGFRGAHANVWLKLDLRGLLYCLEKVEYAKVEIPSNEHIVELKRIVQSHHKLDGFCFESCADLDEQSMYYNGWKRNHYITNLFVFSTGGRCIMMVLNAPGSLHNSTLAEWGGVYDGLEEIYRRTGAKCCVDSAFMASNNKFLINSAQNFNPVDTPVDLL